MVSYIHTELTESRKLTESRLGALVDGLEFTLLEQNQIASQLNKQKEHDPLFNQHLVDLSEQPEKIYHADEAQWRPGR